VCSKQTSLTTLEDIKTVENGALRDNLPQICCV